MCVLCCSKQSGIAAACECLVKRSDGKVCVKSAMHCGDIVLVLIEQTRCRLFIMRDQVAVCYGLVAYSHTCRLSSSYLPESGSPTV